MEIDVLIEMDGDAFEGIIYDGRSPVTAKWLVSSLPLSGRPVKWGGELYFNVPFHAEEENGTEDIDVGDIAYWPPGDVVCIFFGRTPISVDDRPRPASSVNLVGKIFGAERLKGALCPKKITIRPKG